jgi:endothelin-converting enzyme
VLDIAQEVVDLEVKLALALPMPQDLEDPEKTYNKLSIGEIDRLLPGFNVEAIIKELSPAYHPVEVVVASPKYLERLSFVLAGTPVEVIQSYLSWKMIQKLADEVQDPKLEPLKFFHASLKGASQEEPAEPWRRCIREVNQMLGWSMSRFFVQQKTSDSTTPAAEAIVGQVKKSLAKLIDTAGWMSDKDREEGVDKALAISHQIGSPAKSPNIDKPSAVEKFYSKLEITNSHFANKIAFSKFETGRIWSQLTKPTDLDAWHLFSTDVNAYYDHSSNGIVLPAALLQPPFFYDGAVPEAYSYGSLGSLVGHELSHAFSVSGSMIDKDGKLGDWWNSSTRAAFEDKSQCFINQYSKFKVKGPNKELPVNGNLTLAENIADTVGLQVAYLAWQTATKDRPAQALPGLQHFTKEQLFWLAYGNRWCSKTTPEKASQRVLTDKHAPKPARILVCSFPSLPIILTSIRVLSPTQKVSSKLSTVRPGSLPAVSSECAKGPCLNVDNMDLRHGCYMNGWPRA